MAATGLKIALVALPLAAGLLEIGQGAYIHAKAVVAQVLLERAWEKALEGDARARPWSWADTWPVARLRAPGEGIDQIVLEGTSGNVLAFAPGRVPGSAPPGARGRTVISAHRDTHFRFLKNLAPGDRLLMQTPDRHERAYRVTDLRVVDTRAQNGALPYPPGDGLTLVTCYPFDAVAPGGPLRFLVDARPVQDTSSMRFPKN